MDKRIAVVSEVKFSFYNGCIQKLDIIAEREDGGTQNVCDVVLDKYDTETNKRIGTAFGADFVRQALMFFGVDDFSEVKNYICYVIYESDDYFAKPIGLKNIDFSMNDRKPKEFIYKDILKQHT